MRVLRRLRVTLKEIVDYLKTISEEYPDLPVIFKVKNSDHPDDWFYYSYGGGYKCSKQFIIDIETI